MAKYELQGILIIGGYNVLTHENLRMKYSTVLKVL